MTAGERALARARTLIGTPFRLHGRDAGGVDCVGLAAFAWELAVPGGYPLRATPLDRIARFLRAAGFAPTSWDRPGAIVIGAPGPAQLHLGIATGSGVIHADAALRRVVERAAPIGWPVIAAWIRPEDHRVQTRSGQGS